MLGMVQKMSYARRGGLVAAVAIFLVILSAFTEYYGSIQSTMLMPIPLSFYIFGFSPFSIIPGVAITFAIYYAIGASIGKLVERIKAQKA